MLLDLAPPDIAWFQERSDIVLVPIGSCEQHGAHLPLGTDTITALEVSKRAAEKADVPYTAPLWIGYSPQHMRDIEAGVGTVTLRASTFTELLYDILRSLIHHGWNKLILVNGHGSNTKVIDPLLRRIKYETGALGGAVQALRRALHRDPRGPAREPAGGHAGLARLRARDLAGDGAQPGLVRMDRAAADYAQAPRVAAGLVPQARRRARRGVRGLPVLQLPDGPRRVLAHGRDRQPDDGDAREGRGGAGALQRPPRARAGRVPQARRRRCAGGSSRSAYEHHPARIAPRADPRAHPARRRLFGRRPRARHDGVLDHRPSRPGAALQRGSRRARARRRAGIGGRGAGDGDPAHGLGAARGGGARGQGGDRRARGARGSLRARRSSWTRRPPAWPWRASSWASRRTRSRW